MRVRESLLARRRGGKGLPLDAKYHSNAACRHSGAPKAAQHLQQRANATCRNDLVLRCLIATRKIGKRRGRVHRAEHIHPIEQRQQQAVEDKINDEAMGLLYGEDIEHAIAAAEKVCPESAPRAAPSRGDEAQARLPSSRSSSRATRARSARSRGPTSAAASRSTRST